MLISRLFLSLLCTCFASALIQEDARMIGYLENWLACPTAEQLSQYTHIAVGFAVTYTWAPDKNICSETCYISNPPMCLGKSASEAINEWKSYGIKVILSFGGAGMGGSWEGDVNDCWDYCFGRDEQVVDRLVELVNLYNLDGVDIDYEYYYENDQHGRGFTQGPEAIDFLEKVSVGFRQRMPDKIFSHAPMDIDIVNGTEYYEMLKRISYTMDFLMPQYYNGVTRPNMDGFESQVAGNIAPEDHYDGLLEVLDNDPTRIVFGFCIGKCGASGSNINSAQAAAVVQELEGHHNCHGGAFFWAVSDDAGGQFSSTVNNAMAFSRGCNVAQNGGSPVTAPLIPVSLPVSAPVAAPIDVVVGGPVGTPGDAPFNAPFSVPVNAPVGTPLNTPVGTPPTRPSGPDFYDPKNSVSFGYIQSGNVRLALILGLFAILL